MNLENRDLSAIDATLLGPISGEESLEAAGHSAAPRVEIISGTAPRLETETQALLRIRLQAAAIVLLAGVAAFFVRGFFVEGAPARAAQVVVSGVLAAVVATLASKRALSLSQLRLTEIGI